MVKRLQTSQPASSSEPAHMDLLAATATAAGATAWRAVTAAATGTATFRAVTAAAACAATLRAVSATTGTTFIRAAVTLCIIDHDFIGNGRHFPIQAEGD